MFSLIKTSKVPLTPELAKEFATMPAFEGERPLKTGLVEYLRERLESGHFYSPKWAIAWLDGKKYRVNGQNSSTMLAEANGHFPQGMYAIIDEFACETPDDLSDLFAQFDPRVSARTPTEIINAHAKTVDGVKGLATAPVVHAISGIAKYYQFAGKAKRPTVEERARLCREHADFIQWFAGLTVSKNGRVLSRVPVVAALFAAFNVNKDAVTEFANLVNNETHPDSESPTRTLSRFLRSPIVQKGRNTNRKTRWDDRAIYAKCIHAWNSFRRGGITDLKYYAESPLPDPI